MNLLTRRAFLGTGVTALGGLALSPSWLAANSRTPRGFSGGERRLVVIELRGGLDGLAALQPTNSERLYRVRPTLAKPEAQLHKLTDDCGFHPRLAKTSQRFQDGGIGLWRSVGHANPSLSHFESRDWWDEGRVTDVRTGTGWLGAFGETLPVDCLSMLAIGDGALPGSLRGPTRRPPAVRSLTGLEFHGPESPDKKLAKQRVDALEQMLAGCGGDAERDFLKQASLETADAARRLGAAEDFRPKTEWPRTRLAIDLAAVAAVIDAGLPTRVFHVVQNGFDTHADQNAALDRLLAELDGALDAFLAHLARKGRLGEVLVMTTSEFGRRVAESGDGGSTGTDHGTANLLLFAGGAVKPGLFGAAPDLSKLDAAGNYAAAVDFRCIYAAVLAKWFGADADAMLGAAFVPEDVVSA
ncbi:MAG TPA: DUF1501 domain-containing protein [Planctomycetota bacterium]|nr:DUF1501 domain-containing protein [Planctomycetota bacterium]